jgi:ABC-type uncharacterized transport system substrate-binding protein
MMHRLAACLALTICAAPLGAHPHIFVDTGLKLVFDDTGRLARVQVTWAYDEFYSLLITEDMGLDPDYDGKLTPAEVTQLSGFDMQWVEGFNGDLEIRQGEALLALSGPLEYDARFEEGRIITTHWRDVSPGAPADPAGQIFDIKPYDATYYTAYDLTLPIELSGTATCRARVLMPELSANLSAIQQQLNLLDMETTPDDAGLPNIGDKLAQTARVTCAGS